jgi:hypothetical protein
MNQLQKVADVSVQGSEATTDLESTAMEGTRRSKSRTKRRNNDQANKSAPETRKSRVRKQGNVVKDVPSAYQCYFGYEYECHEGHRFILTLDIMEQCDVFRLLALPGPINSSTKVIPRHFI